MPDDPRDILKAAGVECADFDLVDAGLLPHRIVDKRDDCPQCALARIARRLAKYKWQRDEAIREWGEWGQSDHDQSGDGLTMPTGDELRADLDRRWDEHDA